MALAVTGERYERVRTGEGVLVREPEWTARRRELEQAGEYRPVRRDRTKARTDAGTRIREREKNAVRRRIPVLGILGALSVIAVAMLLLMGYIELTQLSSETVTLKSQLSALESEHVVLNAEYERMFDLASVQEAAEAAGMTKPSSSQVGYMDLSDGDSVTVYRHEDETFLNGVLASVKEGFETVREFFD